MSNQPSASGALVIDLPDDVGFTHGHSPRFGGDICWNDIEQIEQMNGAIKSMNRRRAQNVFTSSDFDLYLQNEDDVYFPGKLPYIRPLDPSGYPMQGYNIHGHKNDFDGGFLAGAGNHDHRGAGYGGFAFAVYAPGSSIPLRSYALED